MFWNPWRLKKVNPGGSRFVEANKVVDTLSKKVRRTSLMNLMYFSPLRYYSSLPNL